MNSNELADFSNSVNALIEGKLILVDKNIAQVLKCIATSQVLWLNLNAAVNSMYYPTEFSRARVTWTRSDGVVEAQLKLPADRDRLFAFVVCLLMELDSGRRNILEFLREYYQAPTGEQSYRKFAEEVLKPFKRAGIAILSGIDPESVNAQYMEQAERFFAAEKVYIETALLNSILGEMEHIRLLLNKSALSNVDADEFAAASEYLVNALYLKNPKIISLAFLAYKNTVLRHAQTAGYLANIAQLMTAIKL